MTKMYVKEPNGKYKLVEKDTHRRGTPSTEQAPKPLTQQEQKLTLEGLAARVEILEATIAALGRS